MPQRLTFNGPFGVSIVALAIMFVIVLANLPSVGAALFGSGAGDDEPGEVLARMVALYDKDVEVYEDRFNGRSLFFKPPPKKRPTAPRPTTPQPAAKPRDTTPKLPPGPPPPPPSYNGPSPIGILGDEAWFKPPRAGEEVLRIRVGEEKDGIELVSTDPPWSITVRYNRGEYTVALFERTTDSFFSGRPRTGTAPPGLISADSSDGVTESEAAARNDTPPVPVARTAAEGPDDGAPDEAATSGETGTDRVAAAPVAAGSTKPMTGDERRQAAQRRIEEERLAREREKKAAVDRAVATKAARARDEDASDDVVDPNSPAADDEVDEPVDDEVDYPDDDDPDLDETDGGNGEDPPSAPQ